MSRKREVEKGDVEEDGRRRRGCQERGQDDETGGRMKRTLREGVG